MKNLPQPPANRNILRAVFGGSPVHPYIKQLHLSQQDRFMRISDDHYFAIIETDPKRPAAVQRDGDCIVVTLDHGKRSQKFSLDALRQPARILDYLKLADDHNGVFGAMCAAFADAHGVAPAQDDWLAGEDELPQGKPISQAEFEAARDRVAAEQAARLAEIRKNGNGHAPAGWYAAESDEIAEADRLASERQAQGLPVTASSQADAAKRRERHEAAAGSVAKQKAAARASLGGALRSQQPRPIVGSLPAAHRYRR